MGKSRLVREGRKPTQGRPPPARGRPQAAHRPARAEGTAGDGAPPQARRLSGCRVETVPEGMKPRESGRQSSLSQRKSNNFHPMSQSPQNDPQDSPAPRGMPVYFDDGRELTDIAEEPDNRDDWHPANTAANKLFRCIECL